MTDFEDRARAEAERLYPTDHEVDDPFGETGVARSDPYGYDECANRAFVKGALWACEQEPTEAQVEAAAEALFDEEKNESMSEGWPDSYHSPENVGREIYREHARAALLAAKEVSE